MSILPQLLRTRIAELNISEREVARRTGVSPTTIGRILADKPVDVGTLVVVCGWLGVSVSSVLNAYNPNNLEAKISAILQQRPDLAITFQKLIDQVEGGELPPSIVGEVVAYINYRLSTGSLSNESVNPGNPQRSGVRTG